MIGFEHLFHHGVVDFLNAIEKSETVTPNFKDGVEVMRILEAGLCAAETGKRVDISQR
jgi:predicted dehydrogenase